MTRSILDTDTLSFIQDQRFSEVNATATQYLRVFRYFTVTSISICEVVEGLESIKAHAKLSRFLSGCDEFEILSLGFEEAIIAGRIFATLRAIGLKIGDNDPYIAAIAISRGMPLVTNNLKHYQRIQELGFPLQLHNWRSS